MYQKEDENEIKKSDGCYTCHKMCIRDRITMGRTQLQDAVPIRLGQVFHGYASMVS